MNTIRAICWDVGGVLLNLSLKKGWDMLARLYEWPENSDEVRLFVSESPSFHQFERGQVAFEEFVQACNRRFGRVVDPHQFAQSLRAQLAGPIAEVIALRCELRSRGTFMATASNVNEVHLGIIKELWPEVLDVDFVGASCELGVRKGDKEFWLDYRTRMNRHAQQCAVPFICSEEILFVDDIIDNVRAAQAHGMQAIQFLQTGPESVQVLRAQFAALGLPLRQQEAVNDAVGGRSALSA